MHGAGMTCHPLYMKSEPRYFMAKCCIFFTEDFRLIKPSLTRFFADCMPVVKTHFHALYLDSKSLSVVAIKLRPYTAVVEKLQTLKNRESNYTAREILQPMSFSVRRYERKHKVEHSLLWQKCLSNQQLLI